MVGAGTLTSPDTFMDKEMYVLRLIDTFDALMNALPDDAPGPERREIIAREFVDDLLEAAKEV